MDDASASRQLLDDPVRIDGVAYYAALLDFGPASVDGWLTRIIATELQIEEDSILDVASTSSCSTDRRVDLTKLEFEVFEYLYERPGRWSSGRRCCATSGATTTPAAATSIEALVKSLRRKLGDRAASIETVRGLGYRFVATA